MTHYRSSFDYQMDTAARVPVVQSWSPADTAFLQHAQPQFAQRQSVSSFTAPYLRTASGSISHLSTDLNLVIQAADPRLTTASFVCHSPNYIGQLSQPEELIAPEPESLPSNMLSNRVWVGTLSTPNSVGAACFLEDGTLLTALHVINDIERAFQYGFNPKTTYEDLSKANVIFVKGLAVYSYAIAGVIHDGTDLLASTSGLPIGFDYARLRVIGNPLADLGQGLSLDPINHFSHCMSTDPLSTLAISGPQLVRNTRGQLTAKRYVSVADNEAGLSSFYHYPQVGRHHTVPGFSGQAILPLAPYKTPHHILYAIHSEQDRMSDFKKGIKISEYLSNLSIPSSAFLPISHQEPDIRRHALSTTTYEGLRRGGKDKEEITEFLANLSAFVKANKELPAKLVPEGLQPPSEVFYSDTHQYQHFEQSRKKEGSYFYNCIAKNNRSLVLNALLNAVNKIVSEYYQTHRAAIKPVATNFVVDLGFNIGFDLKANKHTTCVQLQGFSGAAYHIFPIDISNGTPKNTVVINARDMLKKT